MRDDIADFVEAVLEELASTPTNWCIFVTGPHEEWLQEISQVFRTAGFANRVYVHTIRQIMHGALRGSKGTLMIHNEWGLTERERELLRLEQVYLETFRLGRRR